MNSRNEAPNFPRGTKLLGKWNRNVYHILKPLGRGATGVVYLADSKHGKVALKIGHNSMSITSEVNVLKHFGKVQGQILGPSFIDTDDCIVQGQKHPFYVMEYLQGVPVFDHLKEHGNEWAPVFMVQLLGDLSRLHRAGWVFGDLKPENLLITGPPYRVRWLDVGGTTIKGRAIKEYTEFYDRGYWGMGDRKADEQYDLFAAGMIFIHLIEKKRFEKGNDGKQTLMTCLERNEQLRPYRHWLKKMVQGSFQDAEAARTDLMKFIAKREDRHRKVDQSARPKRRKKMRRKAQKQPALVGIVDLVLVIAFLLITSVLYLVGQMI